MIRQISIVLCLFAFLSCKKESARTITYEVILSNATSWSGNYLNENAVLIEVSNQKSGWKHSFKDTNGLLVLVLSAEPDTFNNNSDALMNIYVDGKLYAKGTYNNDVYLNIPFN